MLSFIVSFVVLLIFLVLLYVYDRYMRPSPQTLKREKELSIINFVKSLVFILLAVNTGSPDNGGEMMIKGKFLFLIAFMEAIMTITAIYLDATFIPNFLRELLSFIP